MLATHVKSLIKSRPMLYDFLHRWRGPKSDLERWLDGFSKQHDRVRFLQIGASDGLRWDPLRRLILRDQWRGIFVEPLPAVFALLRQNYAYKVSQGLAFVNAAIGATAGGTVTFWTYNEAFLTNQPIEDRLWFLRQASLDKSHLLNVLKGHPMPETLITSVTVPALTFDALIARHWTHGAIDLVVIDAEGYDDFIVQSMDLARLAPKAIVFEAHNLPEERRLAAIEWLMKAGYQVHILGGDAVAVRQSQ